MALQKIYVIVDQDRQLINEICRIAFKYGWEIDEWFRPRNIKKFTEEDLEKIIEEYGNYCARTLAFTPRLEKGVLEINFLSLKPSGCLTTEKIFGGYEKIELQKATEWIRDQKKFLTVEKK